MQKNLADPLGGLFRSRFKEPAINVAGDVVFHAKARRGGRRLYYYPAVGAGTVVATHGDPAPGGSVFRKFERPTLNDTGEMAFLADLAAGEGIYVRDAGGILSKAVAVTDKSEASKAE